MYSFSSQNLIRIINLNYIKMIKKITLKPHLVKLLLVAVLFSSCSYKKEDCKHKLVVTSYNGSGWYEVPEELIKNMDETHSFFTKLYFTLILLLGGIFGLSFVNAILVDSMVMDNNDKLEEKVDKLNEKIDQLLK